MAEGTTTDISGGIYRRIYAGFVTGKRINSVSVGAEAWFWRLHAIADDFGNIPGDPRVARAYAAPLRDWTLDDVASMTRELENKGLITTYAVNGEYFNHIEGFEGRQPANKSGRRIQRYPKPSAGPSGNPGESGGILKNPGESWGVTAPDTDTDTDTDIRSDPDTDSHIHTHSDTDADVETTDGAGDGVYMERPGTAPGRKERPFVQVFILKLAEAFGWTSVTAMGQKKALSAVARKLLKESDRDELAADFISLAAEKADDPALDKPVAAWQKEVTRILKAREAKRK